VTFSSALGRTSTFQVKKLSNGTVVVSSTNAAGATATLVTAPDGHQSSTAADGTTTNLQLGPDPRWGMRAPIRRQLDGDHPRRVEAGDYQAAFDHPRRPQRLLAPRLPGRDHHRERPLLCRDYVGASRTLTLTRPSGRKLRWVCDDRGRPIEMHEDGLAPMSVTYDARGRPETITRGQGAAARLTTFATDRMGSSKASPIPSTRPSFSSGTTPAA